VQVVAGLPSKEVLVAWAYAPIIAHGQVRQLPRPARPCVCPAVADGCELRQPLVVFRSHPPCSRLQSRTSWMVSSKYLWPGVCHRSSIPLASGQPPSTHTHTHTHVWAVASPPFCWHPHQAESRCGRQPSDMEGPSGHTQSRVLRLSLCPSAAGPRQVKTSCRTGPLAVLRTWRCYLRPQCGEGMNEGKKE
jgi:hypothetical protein